MPFRWKCNKYMCFYCCCDFVDSSKLKQHTKEEHTEVKLKNVLKNVSTRTTFKLDVSEISCKLCPNPVSTVNDFLHHIVDVHDIKFNKNVANCLFVFKLSDERLSCLDCGQFYRFFGPLLAHCNKLHIKTSDYLCETCGQGFLSELYLSYHVKSVHSKSQVELNKSTKISDTKNGQKILRCPNCPEVFSNSYMKQKHLGSVHNIKKSYFSCDLCSRTFIYKNKLIDHKAKIHFKEKGYTCDICGFKVFGRNCLTRHMVRHSDARPFQCDVCEKTFQRKKDLDYHVRIHTNDRRYVCKDCGKAFVQSSSLKFHIRVHHKKV